MLRKSVSLLCCFFMIVLTIIGCGGGGGSSSNPTGPTLTPGATANLSGTVFFDGSPISFASVYLYQSDKAHTVGMTQLPALKGSLLAQQIIGDGAYSTTTDAAGSYLFANIPVGQYTLIALRDETHQFVQTGVLLGQVTTLNPQLTPTGKISGKVSQTIGNVTQSIAGAFVYINGTSYIAVSDTAGNFVINNVPSNSTISGAGYEILVSTGKGTAAPITGVTVSPGATNDIGAIAITPFPSANHAILSGSLVAGTNVTASELANQFVILTHQSAGTILGTYTDSAGKFSFSVTDTGIYLVLNAEEDYDYTPDPLTVNVVNLDNSTLTLSPITVDSAEEHTTGSIAGKVTLSGSPVSGAVVHASGTSLIGVSNAEGNFVIEKVPANSSANPYTLEVSSNMGTAPAKTGIVVNVGLVTDIGAFAITLPTAGYKTITGQLVAVAPVTSGELANRLTQLTCPDGKVLAAYTDTSGVFSFITTQIGDHRVSVLDNAFAYSPRTQSISVTVLDNTSQPLAQQINVTRANSTGSISGQVTAGGSPVTGAIISISGTSLVGVSNNAGNFLITGVPANSSMNPYGIDVTSSQGIAAPVIGVIVTAGEDTNVGVLPVSLPETGYRNITGNLVAVAPLTVDMLTNTLVQMKSPNGKISSAYTDITGAFNFITEQTGSHTFTIIDSRYDYLPRTQAIAVDILDNGSQALPNVSVTRSQINVSVSGTVTWDTPPDGWSIGEGQVILQNQTGTPEFFERRIVAAASPAVFRFDNVPPGDYYLSVDPSANGYQSSALSVTVIAGTDISGLNLTTTVVVPVIQATQIMDENTLQLIGVNFADSSTMQAIVNGRPMLPVDPWNTNAWDSTRCFFELANLPPGEHSVKLEKTIGSLKIYGNDSYFVRPVLPPTAIATSTTNKSMTLTWQNAPMVSEVEILLFAVQVPNPLQIGDVNRVTGNSYTFENLTPGTDYFVRLRSRYSSLFSAYTPDVIFHTESTGLDNIESIALSDSAGQMVFDFEVYDNTAYVAAQSDIGQPITLLAYTDMQSPPLTLTVTASSSCHPRHCSMAVDANGLYLTYADPVGNIAVTQFDKDTLSVIASRSLTIDYGYSNPSMAVVHSFNNRVFLATRDGVYVEACELSALDVIASASVYGYNELTVKSVDLAHDPVTNTLYLVNLGPGELGGVVEIRAFTNMDLNIATLPMVGELEEETGSELTVVSACNHLVFCARNTYSYGITSRILDARSGFVHDYSNATSFGSDRQNRIWVDYNSEVYSNNVFTRLDNGLTIQQTLPDNIVDFEPTLNRICLDNTNGMMYMLYRNPGDDNLMVYRYNSNY